MLIHGHTIWFLSYYVLVKVSRRSTSLLNLFLKKWRKLL
nr:MAG TPA: hypothetical protein [Bacteriophage sp.]